MILVLNIVMISAGAGEFCAAEVFGFPGEADDDAAD
jgi:hypothetical protein